MSRSYNDELQYLDKIHTNCWRIKKGFVPNMQVNNCFSDADGNINTYATSLIMLVLQVEGVFYVNEPLEKLMFEELRNASRGGGDGLDS